MGTCEHRLILFLKYPEKQNVKTRLARSLGDEAAVALYKEMAETAIDAARPLARKRAGVVIAFDPPMRERALRQWVNGPFRFIPQGEGNLGDRLSRVVHAAFQEGAKKVVVIGSDCPDIETFTLRQAFSVLSKKQVVIGPSEDGGYYLIGLTQAEQNCIFEGVPWSTPDVLSHTLNTLAKKGLSYRLLPKKLDIDTAEDLARLSQLRRQRLCDREKVSVILPAFNEEARIKSALIDLTENHRPDEIIVVDGGSSDQTAVIASQYATVVKSEKGRATQMNDGASTAVGGILLFLHVDTRLPPGGLTAVRDALCRTQTQSGRFRMSFGHPHPLLKLYEYQTRFHCFSYGDQGLFIRSTLFRSLGGFDDAVAFEDIDFYRRLLKHDRPIILKDPVTTSPRRFLENGVIRQKLINITLATMFYLRLNAQIVNYFRRLWYKDTRECHW